MRPPREDHDAAVARGVTHGELRGEARALRETHQHDARSRARRPLRRASTSAGEHAERRRQARLVRRDRRHEALRIPGAAGRGRREIRRRRRDRAPGPDRGCSPAPRCGRARGSPTAGACSSGTPASSDRLPGMRRHRRDVSGCVIGTARAQVRLDRRADSALPTAAASGRGRDRSTDSSTAKPGRIVATSNSTPPGSRK